MCADSQKGTGDTVQESASQEHNVETKIQQSSSASAGNQTRCEPEPRRHSQTLIGKSHANERVSRTERMAGRHFSEQPPQSRAESMDCSSAELKPAYASYGPWITGLGFKAASHNSSRESDGREKKTEEMSEEEIEIADIILKEIVVSNDEWHEADEFAEVYGVEKHRMQVILENWARSEIVEWGGEKQREAEISIGFARILRVWVQVDMFFH